MRIRILRSSYGHTDGVDLRMLEVGFSYDVSPALGARLVASRCAELVASLDPMLLVPLTLDPKPKVSGHSVSVADDIGRRESLLSYESDQPE